MKRKKKNTGWHDTHCFMIKNCLICKTEFKTKSSKVKIGWGKFCSQKCWGAWYWEKGRIYKTCEICKKSYRTIKSKPKKTCSSLHANQLRGLSKLAEKNHNFKNWESSLSAKHVFITARKPKPVLCENCNLNKSYDLANISQKYLPNLSDWEWLCRKCHMTKDGRINNLKQYEFK